MANHGGANRSKSERFNAAVEYRERCGIERRRHINQGQKDMLYQRAQVIYANLVLLEQMFMNGTAGKAEFLDLLRHTKELADNQRQFLFGKSNVGCPGYDG